MAQGAQSSASVQAAPAAPQESVLPTEDTEQIAPHTTEQTVQPESQKTVSAPWQIFEALMQAKGRDPQKASERHKQRALAAAKKALLAFPLPDLLGTARYLGSDPYWIEHREQMTVETIQDRVEDWIGRGRPAAWSNVMPSPNVRAGAPGPPAQPVQEDYHGLRPRRWNDERERKETERLIEGYRKVWPFWDELQTEGNDYLRAQAERQRAATATARATGTAT